MFGGTGLGADGDGDGNESSTFIKSSISTKLASCNAQYQAIYKFWMYKFKKMYIKSQ